ncbi:MAG: acyl-CoA thioesterase [Hyphomicrobiales bacterium]
MSYAHACQLRVRYGETDQMGFVYYGVYAQYFEVGRVEAIRSLGITYADLEKKHGIWMPVMNMQVRYLRPARYDDLLTIQTVIPSMPRRDIRFRFEVRNESNTLLSGAVVQLCFLDAATGTRIDTPPFLQEALAPYMRQ